MEHLLFEHIEGYELFELKAFENLAGTSFSDYMVLSQVASHVSSLSFNDCTQITDQIKLVANGEIHPKLKHFLELNSVKTLHCDKSLRNALKTLNIEHKHSLNITRGIKLNLKKILKKAMNKQLVLSASHVIAKENIKYDMEREDNVAISTGYAVDNLEEEIKNLKLKISKMISWYFPQFGKILESNSEILEGILTNPNEIPLNSEFEKLGKPELVKSLLKEMAKDIRNEDKDILFMTVQLINSKKRLYERLEGYLADKMKILAPNLREILGDRLCYKIIHKAGGLLNLCLYPSSTVQLLGAEKALFISLKMKKQTPKYGLLYQLDYLKENQGRMCRYIAAKCSLAARIDYFSDERCNEYGKELRRLIDKKIKSNKSKAKIETSAEVIKKIHDRLKKDKLVLKDSKETQ